MHSYFFSTFHLYPFFSWSHGPPSRWAKLSLTTKGAHLILLAPFAVARFNNSTNGKVTKHDIRREDIKSHSKGEKIYIRSNFTDTMHPEIHGMREISMCDEESMKTRDREVGCWNSKWIYREYVLNKLSWGGWDWNAQRLIGVNYLDFAHCNFDSCMHENIY